MNIYQIIYNSSATTLNGGSGFGVRTVSEGTPREYIDFVNNNSVLRSYNSGKFSLASNLILANPERIFEYPVGYYYRVLQIGGKQVYALGRIVSTCFDHSFYVTGKATRPGNYIAHIFISDEFPGREAFNLFTIHAQEGKLHFVPRDWTPTQSNTEIVALMVGKPQLLPMTRDPFPEVGLRWSEKSLDLLFSYRAVWKGQSPIIVSLRDKISASIVAEFMKLLPESLAKETTFVINHQAEGPSKDVRISFINEYYQHPIYPNLCAHINLMDDGCRPIDNLEKIWRPVLEQALSSNNTILASRLINWIFSRIAEDNVDSSAALNEALFNYSQDPGRFTVDTIDKVGNMLEVLKRYVKQGDITPDHLNSLIIQMAKDSVQLNDFIRTIGYCEKVDKAGLDVSAAREYIKVRFTTFLISDPTLLYDALALLKEGILRKYSQVEQYPRFDEILPEILTKRPDIKQTIVFAKYIVPDAGVRVKNYIYLLDRNPEFIDAYSALLDSDQAEAAKVDYIRVFGTHLNNVAFAPLFYQQVKRESGAGSPLELSRKIYDLALVNPGFSKLVFNNDQIFHAIYGTVRRQLNQDNYVKTSKAIKDYVMPLLSTDGGAGKQWQLLYDVLNSRLPESHNKIQPFYNLAKEIKHLESLKKIAPMCFAVLDTQQIGDFLKLVQQYDLMTDTEIVNRALSKTSLHHLSYILPVAKMYGYDYARIYELVCMCEKNEKSRLKIIKSNFPKLYAQHRKEMFIAKLKSLFTKKKNK